jgi:hypothetical protein
LRAIVAQLGWTRIGRRLFASNDHESTVLDAPRTTYCALFARSPTGIGDVAA